MRPRLLAALAVAAMSPFALAAPASAAPGNGSQPYTLPEECISPEPGVEECSSVTGRFNNTETPSGNRSVVDNATREFTVTTPEFSEAGTADIHYTLLVKDDQDHLENTRIRVNTTIGDVSCTGRGHVLVVKGQTKIDKERFTCDGELPEP